MSFGSFAESLLTKKSAVALVATLALSGCGISTPRSGADCRPSGIKVTAEPNDGPVTIADRYSNGASNVVQLGYCISDLNPEVFADGLRPGEQVELPLILPDYRSDEAKFLFDRQAATTGNTAG